MRAVLAMMRAILFGCGMVAALGMNGAVAQQRVPTDQQIDLARDAMLRAEANYFSLAAQKLQAQLTEATEREAAKERWWDEWWKATYPSQEAR